MRGGSESKVRERERGCRSCKDITSASVQARQWMHVLASMSTRDGRMDAGSRSLTFSHSLPHRTTPQTPGHKCLGRSLRITVPRGFKNTYKNSLFLNAAVKLEEEKVDMAGKLGELSFWQRQR